jgi:two-component system sensor histidine kinase YesM
MPKLILQPIVENCFVHGFRDILPPYIVHIKGFVEGETWRVSVSDNGPGFPEDVICRFQDMQSTYKSDSISTMKFIQSSEIGGIGLMNIYMTLLLFYDNHLHFEVMNDNGAVIIFGSDTGINTEYSEGLSINKEDKKEGSGTYKPSELL